MEVMDWTLMNLEQHSGRFLGKEKMTSRYYNAVIVATCRICCTIGGVIA